MTFTGVMATLSVADLERSRSFYSVVVGREPDQAPIEGLLEWHLGDDPRSLIGFELYLEPARAGGGRVVLHCPTDADLVATRARLAAVGVEAPEPYDVAFLQVLLLADPDGNRVVLTAPLP